MKVVNLTPHTCTVISEGKVVLTIPASGSLARCAQQTEMGKPIEVDGVRISTGYNVFGEVEGLAAPAGRCPVFRIGACSSGCMGCWTHRCCLPVERCAR